MEETRRNSDNIADMVSVHIAKPARLPWHTHFTGVLGRSFSPLRRSLFERTSFVYAICRWMKYLFIASLSLPFCGLHEFQFEFWIFLLHDPFLDIFAFELIRLVIELSRFMKDEPEIVCDMGICICVSRVFDIVAERGRAYAMRSTPNHEVIRSELSRSKHHSPSPRMRVCRALPT